MTEVLYAPNREHVVTSNAWAFLHWLRMVRGVDLAGWAALQRFSVDKPVDFRLAVAVFAGLSDEFQRGGATFPGSPGVGALQRNMPTRDAAMDSGRCPRSTARSTCLAALCYALSLTPCCTRTSAQTIGCWSRAPPGRGARRNSWARPSSLPPPRADLLTTAATERATILVAAASTLAEAAFRRPGRRPDLSNLRTIIATGGPLSPEGRRRIYTWVKSDMMLLARTGDTFWGNPLEPVLAQPPATPAFLTPPASGPATR